MSRKCSIFTCNDDASMMIDGYPFCDGHKKAAGARAEAGLDNGPEQEMDEAKPKPKAKPAPKPPPKSPTLPSGAPRCTADGCELRGDYKFENKRYCEKCAGKAYDRILHAPDKPKDQAEEQAEAFLRRTADIRLRARELCTPQEADTQLVIHHLRADLFEAAAAILQALSKVGKS